MAKFVDENGFCCVFSSLLKVSLATGSCCSFVPRLRLTTNYSWIVCQLEVGTPIITFAVEVQFQTRDQFWNPQPKLQVRMYLIFL